MTRRHRMGYLAAVLVIVVSMMMPTLAWAKYRASGSETNVFQTRVLGTPGRPACTGLGALSVTLTWTAASGAVTYELGEDDNPGGPYTFDDVGTGLSETFGISSGDHYYVVRAVNHNWRGPISAERRVDGFLFLTASCPGP